MNIVKENFNENEPHCRIVRLDGVVYLAYEEEMPEGLRWSFLNQSWARI